MSDGPIVQVQDLWIDLQRFCLRDVNLDIADGEYFIVLGPTGTGKTVLLEAIAGLHRPSRGRILLAGEDITRAPPERRGIGFVYQDYMLFPHLTVADNIAFGLHLRGMDRGTIERRLAAISQLLGIEHLLDRMPGTLSGGEGQRVALARALVIEPRLLLLDEPLSALDPGTREALQRELERLHRELGTTTIHVTHDFEEAVALGDRIAVLKEDRSGESRREGRIVQVGTPEEIFHQPSDEFVARFVGMRNIFRGEAHTAKDGHKLVHIGEVEIAAVTGLEGPVHVSIRPEDILLSREPLRSSARNVFRGCIVDISDRGVVAYITIRVPPDFTCVVTRRSLEEMALREGVWVYLAFKASAVHVF